MKRKPFDRVAPAPGPRQPIKDGIGLDVIRVGYGGSTNTDVRKAECDCEEPLPAENVTRYIPSDNGTIRYHPCRRCGGRIIIASGV